MEAPDLAGGLKRMADASVLVVGDVMLDEYVWGEVVRISPEAPVPVVDVSRRSHVAGGAANAAACVAALGGRAKLVGLIGDDAPGGSLCQELSAGGVDARLVRGARPTTVKTRIIASSQQVVRVDSEDRAALTEALEDEVLARLSAAIEGVDAVVLSDYAKGVVSPRVARAVIDRAAGARKPVVVDPKGTAFSKYRGAAVVTPNLAEAELAAGMRIASAADFDEAARRLRAALADAAVLITRGAEGMSLFLDDSRRIDIPATSRAVYDITGAGDAVVATLGLAVASGVALPSAAALANVAGGVVVEKIGTARLSRAELEEAVTAHAHGPSAGSEPGTDAHFADPG